MLRQHCEMNRSENSMPCSSYHLCLRMRSTVVGTTVRVLSARLTARHPSREIAGADHRDHGLLFRPRLTAPTALTPPSGDKHAVFLLPWTNTFAQGANFTDRRDTLADSR